MQPPAARHLRGEHPRRRRSRHVQRNLVGENRGAVQHSGGPQSRVLDGSDQSHGGTGLGDIPGDYLDAASGGVHFRDCRRNLGAGSRTPVEDNHSGALLRQPPRHDEAQPAHAAHHDVATVAGTSGCGGGGATASACCRRPVSR